MRRQTSDSSECDDNPNARRRVTTVEQLVAGLEKLRSSKLFQRQSRGQEEGMRHQTSDSSESDHNATARRRVPTVEQFVAGLKLRRSKLFKRQSHVPEDGLRRQTSEPIAAAPPAAPALRKHDSYPQYANKSRRSKSSENDTIGSVVIRAVAMAAASSADDTPRASHTPAVRSGPPLSCNFCWNTVDDCGRILRRKTQYHCPECRTNLCIVPCFHEYHEAETEPAANVR